MLQGKDKPTYAPHNDCGDVVVVVNADQVALTGNKLRDKLYFWHTGYPGGIKQRTAREMLEKDGTSVLREAVLRMLPRNLLRDDRARLTGAGRGAATVPGRASTWYSGER